MKSSVKFCLTTLNTEKKKKKKIYILFKSTKSLPDEIQQGTTTETLE